MRQTRITIYIDKPTKLEITVMEDGSIYINPQKVK